MIAPSDADGAKGDAVRAPEGWAELMGMWLPRAAERLEVLEMKWRPQRDSNPRYRRERAMS